MMSRLVVPPKLAVFKPESMSGRKANYEASEDYQSRLAKYIPAEATGGYVALDNLAQSVRPPAAGGPTAESAAAAAGAALHSIAGLPLWPTLIFVACLVFAPLYVFVTAKRENNPSWGPQALIATAAFAVWAYAVHGAFFEFGPIKHDPAIAGILLILFSMGVALYQPKPVN